MGQYDRAVSDLSRAMELGAKGGASGPSGVTLRSRSKTSRPALADYTEVIRLNPDAAAYINRGVAHDRQGDLDKAIQDFDEAIR